MSNEILNSLLKEYEHKKFRAELELDKKKEILYQKVPRLQEIENRLNHLSIHTAKNILLKNRDNLENLFKQIEQLKKEKEEILLSFGYSLNDLKPNYECTFCQDTGYISYTNSPTQMCNCLKQKLLDISFHQSNMSNLDKENFSTFNELLFSAEVDLAKFKANVSPRTNIKNIKNKCQEFVENFDDPHYKNLLFTGNTGLR